MKRHEVTVRGLDKITDTARDYAGKIRRGEAVSGQRVAEVLDEIDQEATDARDAMTYWERFRRKAFAWKRSIVSLQGALEIRNLILARADLRHAQILAQYEELGKKLEREISLTARQRQRIAELEGSVDSHRYARDRIDELTTKMYMLLDTLGWPEDETFEFPDGEVWRSDQRKAVPGPVEVAEARAVKEG